MRATNPTRPRRLATIALLALAGLASTAPAAGPQDYTLDPVHSRIAFAVDHQGFARALGTFSAPQGHLRFDPDDWSTATVQVEIALDTLDLGDAKWNAAILKRSGFDHARHPLARFRSTRIEPIDARRARVHGELSLRGQTAPLVLEVQLNRRARNPMTLRRTIGFSATATLSRRAFGMEAWRTVGDDVQLTIEVEAVRARQPDRPAEADDAAA